jgi:hypothetical protein
MKLRGWVALILLLAVAPAVLTGLARELVAAALTWLLSVVNAGGL